MPRRRGPSPTPPKGETCCLPGDITVTKIPTGYLLGRAIEQIGPGPWWEYIAIVSSFRDATHQALTLAQQGGVRAWLHKADDEYELLKRTADES